MHEIGVLKKAVDLCNQIALDNHIDEIQSITLEVGELSGYLPVFFEKYYPIVIEDYPIMKNSHIKCIVIKGQAVCDDCQTFYNVMKQEGKCPKCHSRNKTVISGQEFKVKNIEYEKKID